MATAGDARGSGPERAFVDAALPSSGLVTLDAEESRHLVRSRRVRVGDPVVLFDGRGGTVAGRLHTADPHAAAVTVEGPYPDREPPRPLVLAVSWPEAGRADQLVQGLAELGVERVVPFLSARTPPRRADLAGRRRTRWRRLAREAAKVSGRSRLLEVAAEPLDFAALLAAYAPRLVLLDPDPARPALAACLPATGPLPLLAVGPEGGFTDEEVEAAAAQGAGRARIGVVALRTETAALAAAAIALGG